MKSTHSNAN